MSAMRTLLSAAKRRLQVAGWHAGHLAGFGRKGQKVAFVSERNDWSIRWDGLYVTEHVNRLRPNLARLTDNPAEPTGSIVHFGSQYMWANWGPLLSSANRYVVTYFHGKPEDGPDAARNVEEVLALLPRTEFVITAASAMECRLLEWGVPREKLVRIPIGVDTSRFVPVSSDGERLVARQKFGIPADRLCIGSFQKDGVGWGDGSEPKLIKGPDIFIKAIERMARERQLFVLLTGPARGYVKAALEKMGVPYRHIFLKDYLDIVSCYQAIDMYLMTSREEGGPKSIMESMATGVPIVATRCGMAEDIIRDGENGTLSPVGDADHIADRALSLLGDTDRLKQVVATARTDILAYDWSHVGEAHWAKVYHPILEKMA